MGNDCGCGKSLSTTETSPKQITPGTIITKKTCPKCSYWMSLQIRPDTKEKNYVCQSKSCSYVMPFSQQQPSQSQPLPL